MLRLSPTKKLGGRFSERPSNIKKIAFAKYEELVGKSARARRLTLEIQTELQRTEWQRDQALKQRRAAELEQTRLAELNAALAAANPAKTGSLCGQPRSAATCSRRQSARRHTGVAAKTVRHNGELVRIPAQRSGAAATAGGAGHIGAGCRRHDCRPRNSGR